MVFVLVLFLFVSNSLHLPLMPCDFGLPWGITLLISFEVRVYLSQIHYVSSDALVRLWFVILIFLGDLTCIFYLRCHIPYDCFSCFDALRRLFFVLLYGTLSSAPKLEMPDVNIYSVAASNYQTILYFFVLFSLDISFKLQGNWNEKPNFFLDDSNKFRDLLFQFWESCRLRKSPAVA